MNNVEPLREKTHGSNNTWRNTGIILFFFLVMFLLVILSLSLGSLHIPFLDVLSVFTSDNKTHKIVILDLRLPRTILAVLIGAALGTAGAILQSVFRNSLASPDLLGITGGASFAAVAFMTLLAGQFSIHWLPLVAIGGAFVTAP